MADISITKCEEPKNIQTREETRARERYITPAVDIFETAECLKMVADIPGATKDALDINIDKGILTLNAPVSLNVAGRPIYTEFEFTHYYRQFSIPESLDHEKAKAEFSNGVLTLNIPVAESAKPRRIEVKSA